MYIIFTLLPISLLASTIDKSTTLTLDMVISLIFTTVSVVGLWYSLRNKTIMMENKLNETSERVDSIENSVIKKINASVETMSNATDKLEKHILNIVNEIKSNIDKIETNSKNDIADAYKTINTELKEAVNKVYKDLNSLKDSIENYRNKMEELLDKTTTRLERSMEEKTSLLFSKYDNIKVTVNNIMSDLNAINVKVLKVEQEIYTIEDRVKINSIASKELIDAKVTAIKESISYIKKDIDDIKREIRKVMYNKDV